ncbi:MAG: hypothetical protein M3Q58_05620 [Bacteroidota bacterium]|nr:hypothetical protein [Bacteroidota bacterium]
MKNNLLLFFLFLFFFSDAKSQNDTLVRAANNSLYIEAGGIAGYGSVNYEKFLLKKNNFKLVSRIGISTYHLRDYTTRFNPDIIIPLAVNFLFGKNHNVEFGVGQTFTKIVYSPSFDINPKRKTNLSSNITIGYRYHKTEGGFVFRCGYTPIIENNKYFRHWAGISFGFAF